MLRSGRAARERSGQRSRSAKPRRRGVPASGSAAVSVPLSDGQRRVLELIATGAPLVKTLESLVLLIEADLPGMLGSVLLLDDDGKHVRHGAAPNLPPEYCEAIDGAAIGPRAGSCGTAAYRNENVMVEDIESDPLWTDYRALAAQHKLRACWSTPIRDSAGRVLGTFAMYFREPRRPEARHLPLIEVATHTAAIAIVKAKGERERARLVRDLGERVKEVTVLHETARLLQPGRAMDNDLLSDLARLIPPAWQYPDICEARITHGHLEGKTPGWVRTPWTLSAEFTTGDGRFGSIEVAYREQRPGAASPFLQEERNIIRSLSDMLVAHVERARVQSALSESETVFRSIFENAAIGITMVDLDERFARVNPAFASMLGYTQQELVGRTFSEFTHPDDVDSNKDLFRALRDGEINHFLLQKRYIRKDKSVFWAQITVSLVDLGESAGRYTMGMVEDVTGRKEAEAKIGHLAYHDPLTALPNRASLQERLAQAVEKARAGGHLLALLLMNLRGFGDINNTLGHQNGDLLLREIATRLREALWQSDLVASLGGDEFAILLGRLASRNDIDLVMEKITGTLRRPVTIAGIPLNVEAALGVALYPTHGETPETLWQHADVALRAARERVVSHLFYAPEIDHFDPRRLALLGELGEAIARDQLVLHFQPKVNLKTGRAVAVEALVRWKHPQQGLIFPDRFIPMAERTQLINPLTTWVLANALRQARAWEQAGLPLWLSVNLSARNLHNPNLSAEILDLARSSHFPLERLTMEITESALMAEPELAKKVLAELHEAGIHFSMDDFGIGQSSLAYLKDLPISKMKIDKSFTMGITEPRNAGIVRSAIELGHNLQLEVTAEGVEDQRAFEALWLFGCDIGQGYHFAKPMPVDPVTAWLKESRWAVTAAQTPAP